MIDWWQDAGVGAIVAGAVWYLARRLFGRPPAKSAATFVPLSSVKRRDSGSCH